MDESYPDDQQSEQEIDRQHGQEQKTVCDDVSTVTSSHIQPPPRLQSSASGKGSDSTNIMSGLEMPLFEGSKRVFTRDASLFVIGKYIVTGRWFVAQVVGRGSLIIDEPSPQDFPMGGSVRTLGPDDQWRTDQTDRLLVNGVPFTKPQG